MTVWPEDGTPLPPRRPNFTDAKWRAEVRDTRTGQTGQLLSLPGGRNRKHKSKGTKARMIVDGGHVLSVDPDRLELVHHDTEPRPPRNHRPNRNDQ